MRSGKHFSKSTSLTLGEHWEIFIKNEVASRRYGSASEVVRDEMVDKEGFESNRIFSVLDKWNTCLKNLSQDVRDELDRSVAEIFVESGLPEP